MLGLYCAWACVQSDASNTATWNIILIMVPIHFDLVCASNIFLRHGLFCTALADAWNLYKSICTL